MNIKAYKKLYKKATLNEVCGLIKENLDNQSDLNVPYDEGKIFLKKRFNTDYQMFP